MAPDAEGSRITDVAKRMGKGANYASTYKARLLKQGVIEELDNGRFTFAIPLLREFLMDYQRQS